MALLNGEALAVSVDDRPEPRAAYGVTGRALSAVLEYLAGDFELVLLLDDLGQLAVDDLLPRSRLSDGVPRTLEPSV